MLCSASSPLSRSVITAAVCLLMLAGCAAEQPLIDRVQPNRYDKSFFVGALYLDTSDDPEFYSQGTLTDVGYGASQDGLFTSTYAQPLTRVRWTITEDMLIARLAYERIATSDGKGAGKATNDGIVVAAYRILSHFDVKLSYNPSTGERYNVAEENVVDRPWYDRQYIRVDWSKNLSVDNFDYDTLSQLGVYGGVVYTPLAYAVQDPTHEDAPHVDPDQGYLDITNKAFAQPQMINLAQWGLGSFPACMIGAEVSAGTAPVASCAPVELTIRNSFRRVVPNDYEPADWDGYRFQAFGAFTTDRHGYSRNYGMTDTQWYRLINRYDIWERNHKYADPAAMVGEVACFTGQSTPAGKSPHRDENSNGTEDECERVGGGSRCDAFTQRCTLPYRERVTKPVVWYYSSGSNLAFFEPTRDAAHEWDVALRSSVQAARYTECTQTQGSNCAAQYPVYFGQQDENEDAINLAREVDDCRAGRAYPGKDCTALAGELGAQRKYSAGVIALAKMPEMVVLCHSPVEANDPAACGGPRLPADVTASQCQTASEQNETALLSVCRLALNVRRGDIRYHQVNGIQTPQSPSPWGIMVDSNDPLTGETIAASINVWTHVNDLWSQSVVDTARYIRGELTTGQVTEGTYVKDWASAASASSKGALPKLGNQQLKEMFAQFSNVSVQQLEHSRQAIQGTELAKKLHALSQEASSIRADAFAPSANKPLYEARRKKSWGTPTEAALTTRMMQSFAGGVSKVSSDLAMEMSSPMRGANPSVEREMRNRRELALADQGICVMNEAPAPFAIADLASHLEAKFGRFDATQSKEQQLARGQRMQQYLAYKAHYAVVAHEMGHSVGLRHNFVSSSDAWNYRPQYWQLRTDNGSNTTECTDLNADGRCVGPRYFDPVTAVEKDQLITMFMQSSTMDYAGEAAQDLIGLGAYDFAAARMFYGDVAAVFSDPSFKSNMPRGTGALSKLDNFGGILGFRPAIGKGNGQTDDIHYSQLQKNYALIQNCQTVDAQKYKPASWDSKTLGSWSPLLDGLMVQMNGQYTRCKQQPLDYVPWSTLRAATADEFNGYTRARNVIDKSERVRFPYGFATDSWADLGNLSVYRHDNGADAYELFDFLITQQEVNHIFDNYRRGRATFSVRAAANRTLSRYNEKLRDAAKGLGLMTNIYRDLALELGYDFEGIWPYLAQTELAQNVLASGIAFDHFARQFARPEMGPHYIQSSSVETSSPILRSGLDTLGPAGTTVLNIPNGATGYYGNVLPGGRPMENALAEDKGEYDREYVLNAGSYYDKAYTAMLFTESVDNFISDSRRDFLDGRYRSVSLADVFPDGYRRWLGNNLTGDTVLKGPRIATVNNLPSVDKDLFPTRGIGWTSWWKPQPEICFAEPTTLQCSATPPATSLPLDPQANWEQQKFLVAWTLMFLTANEQQPWVNQMGMWMLGTDNDPTFTNRIEFHMPSGKIYVAKTFGKETLLGKTVQKGVAARVLEWANELLFNAYETDAGPDLDADGKPDWYLPRMTQGQPRVKYDRSVSWINPATGGISNTGRDGCNNLDNSKCTCSSNRACVELTRYEEIPFFMRQAIQDYGLSDPSLRGIF